MNERFSRPVAFSRYFKAVFDQIRSYENINIDYFPLSLDPKVQLFVGGPIHVCK